MDGEFPVSLNAQRASSKWIRPVGRRVLCCLGNILFALSVSATGNIYNNNSIITFAVADNKYLLLSRGSIGRHFWQILSVSPLHPTVPMSCIIMIPVVEPKV